MLEFRVLGTLEIVSDSMRLSVPSRRQRALVVRLLLGQGRVVPADDLIAAVWEEDPPAQARHALHAQVSRLRSLLAPRGDILVTQPPGYALHPGAEAVDAQRFETSLRRARALLPEEPAAVLAAFDEALAMWRGPAYAEFAESFARAAAVRLEEFRLTAREDRCEALLAIGAPERAVGELSALVSANPLGERPHGQLMRALYLAGRQIEALELYRDFRDRQREELGVSPSPELERVHDQVLRQEIPQPSAPATATVAAPRTAAPIPAPLTSFVGRESELRRLKELIGENRIVTLVGLGGVGKTRLAWELALRLSGSAPPVWWVDLSPTREPTDVAHRFSHAFGLHEPAEGDVEEFLVASLRGVTAVIVVDNCEHVVSMTARLLERIAQRCPGTVLLVTSRERLAVPGERVLPVSSLCTPAEAERSSVRDAPAVALFLDRLRAAGGPELSAEDMTLVAELCQRLDGLPLAIELAAARTRSLGLAAVAERPALDLLAGGRRGDETRHRSVRAVLDWSYDLLEPEERVLLRRLAVFSGRFALDDAENVCADEHLGRRHVAGSLAGLVDKSMVAGPERDRYRLLDTVRAYACERLAEHGESTQVSAAHARHFVRFAERAAHGLRTPDEPVWVTRVTDRLDELRLVHRWACANDADLAVRLAAALAEYARYRMRFEVQEWAEAAAALPDAVDHPLRPVALAAAASGAWGRGDFSRAAQLARDGLAAAAERATLAAPPMIALGDVALLQGRFAEAADTYGTAARLAGEDDPVSAAEALGSRAVALSYQGDTVKALRLVETAQSVARGMGAPGPLAMSRYFAGECRLTTDPAAALESLEESRRLASEVDALFITGIATLSSVSLRAREATDPAAALAAYREAIEHWRRVGNRTQQWVTLRNVVPLLVRAGQEETACLIHGALASAPARLPDDAPEATPLVEAIAQAYRRLGSAAARAAGERGAQVTLEDLVDRVLAAIETAPPTARRVTPDQAGSSR